MNSLTRLGTGIGILAAIVACLSYLRGPLGELLEQQASLAAEDVREVGIEETFDAIWRRREEKTRVVNELNDGHVHLLEAAQRFRNIMAELPDDWQNRLRVRHGGGPEEAWSCRSVIDFVQRDAVMNEASRAELLGRLDTELCNLIHEGAFDHSEHAGAKAAGSDREAR